MSAAVSRRMFDLAGADPALRFSPFCWRIRMALAHKGLEVETVPWRFTERDRIAFSGQGLVPVLCDGARVVTDSFAIAEYLEAEYPDRPSLFGGPAGLALTRFVDGFANVVMAAGLAGLIVSDIPPLLDDVDRAYFVESREKRFGRKLAEVTSGRESAVTGFRAALQPLRIALRASPFLGGDAPLYADYSVFGSLQWARCVSAFPILTPDDPLHSWRGRMLDLFGGLARDVPHFDRAA